MLNKSSPSEPHIARVSLRIRKPVPSRDTNSPPRCAWRQWQWQWLFCHRLGDFRRIVCHQFRRRNPHHHICLDRSHQLGRPQDYPLWLDHHLRHPRHHVCLDRRHQVGRQEDHPHLGLYHHLRHRVHGAEHLHFGRQDLYHRHWNHHHHRSWRCCWRIRSDHLPSQEHRLLLQWVLCDHDRFDNCFWSRKPNVCQLR